MNALFVIFLFLLGLGVFLYIEYRKNITKEAAKKQQSEDIPAPPETDGRVLQLTEFTTQRAEAPAQARPLHTDDCLTPEQEKQAIVLDPDGVPNIKFKTWRNRLVPSVPEGIVNPKSRSLYKYGIYIFNVRGTSYHEQEVKKADTNPGSPARLVREPQNEYDPNAIAIYDEQGMGPLGYVNKLNAKRLAPKLDAGEDLVAFFTRSGDEEYESLTTQVAVMTKALAEQIL
jgi:hypothetical protein